MFNNEKMKITDMKKSFVIMLSAVLFTACNVNPVTVDRPDWKVTATGSLSTMTVVFSAPEGVEATASDLAAAFSGEECVGVVEPVSTSAGWRVMLCVQEPAEPGPVTLRYYAASEKLIYEAVDAFSFSTDASLGIIDNPATLTWTIVR